MSKCKFCGLVHTMPNYSSEDEDKKFNQMMTYTEYDYKKSVSVSKLVEELKQYLKKPTHNDYGIDGPPGIKKKNIAKMVDSFFYDYDVISQPPDYKFKNYPTTSIIDFSDIYPSTPMSYGSKFENTAIKAFKKSQNTSLPPSPLPKTTLYEYAQLYEYIKILAADGKLSFWDLFRLQEIHKFPLIDNIKDTPEPSDDIIYQIII